MQISDGYRMALRRLDTPTARAELERMDAALQHAEAIPEGEDITITTEVAHKHTVPSKDGRQPIILTHYGTGRTWPKRSRRYSE